MTTDQCRYCPSADHRRPVTAAAVAANLYGGHASRSTERSSRLVNSRMDLSDRKSHGTRRASQRPPHRVTRQNQSRDQDNNTNIRCPPHTTVSCLSATYEPRRAATTMERMPVTNRHKQYTTKLCYRKDDRAMRPILFTPTSTTLRGFNSERI